MKCVLTAVLIFICGITPSYSHQAPAQYIRLGARLLSNINLQQQLKMYAARDATLSLCAERSPDRYETISSQFTKFSVNAEHDLVAQELGREKIVDPDTILIIKVMMAGFTTGYETSFNDELRYKLRDQSVGVIQATCDNEVVSATNLMASK